MKQQLVFWSRYTVHLNDGNLLLRIMPLCVIRQVVPDGLTEVCPMLWRQQAIWGFWVVVCTRYDDFMGFTLVILYGPAYHAHFCYRIGTPYAFDVDSEFRI